MSLRFRLSLDVFVIALMISGWTLPSASAQHSDSFLLPFAESSGSDVTANSVKLSDVQSRLTAADAPHSEISDRDLALERQLDALRKEFGTFKDGLSKPKFPSVEVHGAIQMDSGWFHQSANNMATINDLDGPAPGNGNIRDGADFRRVRLSANGAVLPNMNYFLQMDFAAFGRPTFTDVWMEFTKVPVLGNIRAGQWKQPFSLEVVSSFRYTTFAERSVLFNAFDPFRHIGVGFWNYSEDEMMTWAASFYRPGQDQFGGSLSDVGGYAGVGRITMLPWFDDDGSNYLHLGAAYNYVNPKDNAARFRTIPEYFIGEQAAGTAGTSNFGVPGVLNGTPFFVDTGAKTSTKGSVDHYHLIGSELLWVNGSLSVQSEAMWLFGERTNGRSMYFPGMYAQAGYFLTGEHRPYNRKQGAIDRIQVLRPFGHYRGDDCEWGWGGWEIAARYSYIDLNSKDITGGRLKDITLGLNWYINNFSKIQFNYIRAFLNQKAHGDSTADIFGLRAQVDF